MEVPEQEECWYAVYVRPKSEKAVAQLLHNKGIEAYVPLRRLVRSYTRKRRVVYLPLISCYVFVKINSQHFVSVLRTDHVFQFVKFEDRVVPIPDAEMQIMRRVVGELDNVSIERIIHWKIGDEVEIIGGSLTGIRGHLVRQKGKKAFVVRLQTLGFQIPVEIDSKLLKAVG